MRVLQSSEMKEMDRFTIEELGIPSRVLMERAGVSVVLALEHEMEDLYNKSFVVVVGKGNNGGDGLVVARTLLDYSFDVNVVLLSKELKGNPKENFEVYTKMGGNYFVLGEDIDLAGFESLLMGADVVVDAILGIGLKGDVREDVAEVIDMINMAPAYKVCVDISSGVDSDTGKVMGRAIRCDLTVTFAYPKVGHILYPGREYTGKLKVASIGIPKYLADRFNITRYITTANFVREILPERPKDSHKGTFGKVAIVAGSKIYKGAAVLSALGSLHSGVGLTYLLVPEEIHEIPAMVAPEVITVPVPSCDGYFCEKSVDFVKDFLKKVDVFSIGPGLSQGKNIENFVKSVLKVERPAVVDADALNNVDITFFKERKAPTIITPHPGEFARLLGKDTRDVIYNYKLAEEVAKEYGIVILLKGATTIVTDGKETYFNITGDTGLAKGGSGDVLTGMIASFMAQGLSAKEAAIVSAYIHGRTTEYADCQYSFSATEVARNIGKVIRDYLK